MRLLRECGLEQAGFSADGLAQRAEDGVVRPAQVQPTVVSLKGISGEIAGNTQVKHMANTAMTSTVALSTRTIVGPGRWRQIHPYIVSALQQLSWYP